MITDQQPALSETQKAAFRRDGYLLVPGLLTAEQVRRLRAFLLRKFLQWPKVEYPGDTGNVLFDLFNRYAELRWLLFHEPTIRVLRELLGDDYVVLRESAAHFDFFSDWHKDTSSQERDGRTFHREADYQMVEVAYYLQDNTPELGGGLEVQPGSHLEPDYFVRPRGLWERLRRKLTGGIAPYSIPSKAGDLVIFDFRTNHRASRGARRAERPEDKKLAIFYACSRNNAHVRDYHAYIASRPSYVYLQGFRHAPEVLEEAEERGVTIG